MLLEEVPACHCLAWHELAPHTLAPGTLPPGPPLLPLPPPPPHSNTCLPSLPLASSLEGDAGMTTLPRAAFIRLVCGQVCRGRPRHRCPVSRQRIAGRPLRTPSVRDSFPSSRSSPSSSSSPMRAFPSSSLPLSGWGALTRGNTAGKMQRGAPHSSVKGPGARLLGAGFPSALAPRHFSVQKSSFHSANDAPPPCHFLVGCLSTPGPFGEGLPWAIVFQICT